MHEDGAALIAPHGGTLVDLVAPAAEREELTRRASALPSLSLTTRTLCDLELLAAGAFSPLDRFMGEADYRRVLAEMRLASGALFPGIDDPYEAPVNPDLVLETEDVSPEQNAQRVLDLLLARGFVPGGAGASGS